MLNFLSKHRKPDRKDLQMRHYTAPTMIGTGRPPRTDAPDFGRRLASARVARGWTQTQLAELLGTTQKMIDYYERRAPNPSVQFVRRAAELFETSVDDLLGHQAPASAGAGKKPGPAPKLQERFERVRQLPRKDQEFILQFLDTYLERAGKAT